MNKIKAVILDNDGTIIHENSWMKLNLALGVDKDTDRRLYDEYHAGKFSYQDWIDQIIDLYLEKGPVHRQRIESVLLDYTLDPLTRAASYLLQNRGYFVGIVSGGIDVVVHAVAKDIGIQWEYACANSTIKYDKREYLRTIVSRGEDHEIKVQDLHRLCNLWNIDPRECVCVGDGNPDRALFSASGRGITFNDPRCRMLQEHPCCWRTVDHLYEILHYLPRRSA